MRNPETSQEGAPGELRVELAGTLALGRLSQTPAVEETFSTCLPQDTATTRRPE